MIWLAIRRRSPWPLGAALGAGLLTKSYFLAAFAGVALVVYAPRALLTAAVLSGWWYARNLIATGTVTGWASSSTGASISPWTILRDADSLPWRAALSATLASHLYFGGWSALVLDRGVYRLLYVLIALAILGAITLWNKPEFRSLMFFYALLWGAQLYNVMVNFSVTGAPVSLGWYLYAAITAQTVLTLAGLRRIFGGAAIWIAAAACGALDLYAMHGLALPYFTGGAGWTGWFERLAMFKPPFVGPGAIAALWALYAAATAALIAISAALSRGVKRA